MNLKRTAVEAALAKSGKTLKGYLVGNRKVGPKALALKLTKRTKINVTGSDIMFWREDSFSNSHGALRRDRFTQQL